MAPANLSVAPAISSCLRAIADEVARAQSLLQAWSAWRSAIVPPVDVDLDAVTEMATRRLTQLRLRAALRCWRAAMLLLQRTRRLVKRCQHRAAARRCCATWHAWRRCAAVKREARALAECRFASCCRASVLQALRGWRERTRQAAAWQCTLRRIARSSVRCMVRNVFDEWAVYTERCMHSTAARSTRGGAVGIYHAGARVRHLGARHRCGASRCAPRSAVTATTQPTLAVRSADGVASRGGESTRRAVPLHARCRVLAAQKHRSLVHSVARGSTRGKATLRCRAGGRGASTTGALWHARCTAGMQRCSGYAISVSYSQVCERARA